MNKLLKILFLLFLSLGTSCNKDESSPFPAIFTQLEGEWQFEDGILDGMRADIWTQHPWKLALFPIALSK